MSVRQMHVMLIGGIKCFDTAHVTGEQFGGPMLYSLSTEVK
jgi:hypothetical protein